MGPVQSKESETCSIGGVPNKGILIDSTLKKEMFKEKRQAASCRHFSVFFQRKWCLACLGKLVLPSGESYLSFRANLTSSLMGIGILQEQITSY